MTRYLALSRLMTAAVLLCMATPSLAAALSGTVKDVNGKPLAQASIILERSGAGLQGATWYTVFSDQDGTFQFPDVPQPIGDDSTITVRKLGYRQVAPADNRIFTGNGSAKALKKLRLIVEPHTNMAGDVPASAWLGAMPHTQARDVTQWLCIGCHQFPNPAVQRYAEQIASVKGPADIQEAARLKAWKDQIHKDIWRFVIKYMRAKIYGVMPNGSEINLKNVPWNIVQASEYSLFSDADEAMISDYLAQYMPTQFDRFENYQYGAELLVNKNTVIKEYRLPDDSLVRESTLLVGSDYIWGADVARNKILKLDPVSGKQEWIDGLKDEDGPMGPHTIVGDADGKLWVGMVQGDVLARLDPKTSQWKSWSLRPPEFRQQRIFGGQAIVHDMTFDYRDLLARDAGGQLWVTLIGSNKMGSLNLDSGDVVHYPAPEANGRSGIGISLYGTLLDSKGECAWFSQLGGYFGCFNTRTKQIENLVELPLGTAPRRLAIDKNDMIWVPLFGSGQLMKYDGAKKKKLAIYDLPDRASAPYTVIWDEQRKLVWVGTSNGDVIYSFNPVTEKFGVLPLPRKNAYFRKLYVDPKSGDLIASYAFVPAGASTEAVVVIHPGF